MNSDWRDSCPSNKDRIQYMYKNNLRTDCAFVVGDGEEKKVFRAHSLVLVQVSAVFDAMFHGGVGQERGNICIPDIHPGVFEAFLNAIYLEVVNPTSFADACDLICVASKYMVKTVQDQCLSYLAINITPSNAATGYEVLSLYGHRDLALSCWKVIQEETSEVLNSEDFMDVRKETLVRILDEDRLAVGSESELLSAVQRWVDADLQRQGLAEETDRLALLSEFLPYIRFTSMSAKEFLSFPARKTIFSWEENDSILNKILDPESPASLPPNVCSKKRTFLPKKGTRSARTNSRVTAGSSTRQVPLPGDWKEKLRSAAIRGDVGDLRRLQAAGADLSVTYDDGKTLLQSAAVHWHPKCVQWLLEQGPIPHSTPDGWSLLREAAVKGDLEIVRLLLDSGADPDAGCCDGRTPLFCAVNYGNLGIVRLLLDNGADPAARDSDCMTPLHRAAYSGSMEIVRLLLDSGADPAARDSDCWTPLHRAAYNGSLETVRLLLDSGADPAARDSDCWTPLHRAAYSGSMETVRLLLDSGADPAARDKDCWTPLHRAAYNGSLETVRLLLDSGADPADRDSAGRTALNLAISNRYLAVADLLRRRN